MYSRYGSRSNGGLARQFGVRRGSAAARRGEEDNEAYLEGADEVGEEQEAGDDELPLDEEIPEEPLDDEEEIEADLEGTSQPAEEEDEEGDPDAPPEEEPEDRREDDLALTEVPVELRETVEESIKLKRALSTDTATNGSSKRRKTGEPAAQAINPAVRDLLVKWNLMNDVAARYVLGTAEQSELDALKKSDWKPRAFDGQKSSAEMINDRVIQERQRKLPHGQAVDTIDAFKHRWGLSTEDAKLLKGLIHKDLQYVMRTYDGSRPIADVADEASMEMPEDLPEKAQDAAPDKPGLFTVSRLNRLELIDPVADALVVGDANLTFSLMLAAHRKGLGHVGRIVATTFETIEILKTRYEEIDQTVKKLEDHCAEVLHGVDCTRLAVDPRFLGMEAKFGAVYYNFPHAGVVKGFFDGHPFVRWRHENLMILFFRALRGFVKPGGIVKVASNSNATGVKYSDIMLAADASEFEHFETVPFLEWQLRAYMRSYGDRRDVNRRPEDGEIYRSQRAHSDMVYAFRYAPKGPPPPKPRVRYPPAREDLLAAQEGHLRNMNAAGKQRRVEEIYELFLSYVAGIHIG